MRFLAIVTAVAGGLTFVMAPTGSAVAAEKSYSAGLRFLSIPIGGEEAGVAVWYPTLAKENGLRIGLFSLKVSKDAPLAPGRFALIVISHGAGGGYLNHRDTGRALARAGRIVAAVHHPGDNWQDGSRTGTAAEWQSRPRDISAVIDTMLADATFGKAIDAKRIGAVGYSAGGYTALALLGAKPDLTFLIRHCKANRLKDLGFCNYGSKNRAGNPTPTLALSVKPDPRIRAAVVMAPVGAIFGPGAFKAITAPIRLYRGGKDAVLRFPFHAEYVHKNLPAAHDYVVVRGIGHFAFIAPFPESLRDSVGVAARDPPGVDRAAFHTRLNREIVAFFAKTLK